ncbi:MAG TPA: hypothetical protein ENI60_01430 [Candidatus Fraserbacteria bacterium]|nr:hypothetical protein [Candidatus Fraserbacteria bacterium]
MRKELLSILVEPTSKAALHLEVHQTKGDEIFEGSLHDDAGRSYPIVRGIAGVYNLNGEPVPTGLLKRMTGVIAHRLVITQHFG